MDRDELVSTAEAGRRLGYTRQHVRRLIKERQIDGYRVGRDWLIPESSIAKYGDMRKARELKKRREATTPLTRGSDE